MNLQTHITELEKSIKSLEDSNEHLYKTMNTLKETPIGLRERLRQMKQINDLSKTCGGRQKRMKLARDCIGKIFGLNMHNSIERVQLLNETMNRIDIVKLLKLPKNQKLRKITLEELIDDMNSLTKPSQIVDTCDKVGVSRKGYQALSGLWFKNLK